MIRKGVREGGYGGVSRSQVFDLGQQGGELGTDTERCGVIMSTVLRFCHYKQSATLSAWHQVLASGETHCWGCGRTLPLRTITPNGRRRVTG